MPADTLSIPNLQLNPDPQHQDSYYNDVPVVSTTTPSLIADSQDNPIQPPSISFNDQPSLDKQLEPSFFNWQKTNADLYTKDKYYNQLGFDPQAGQINDEKYSQAHTWVDNFRDSFAGVLPEAWSSAKNQLYSWKDTLSVFQDPTLRSAFKADEMDELNQKNQEFQDKYHIFKTEGDNNSFFSWDNFFAKVQGIGPIVGSIAELAAEEAATQLIVGATMGGALPAEAAEQVRAGNIISKTLDTGKQLLYGDLVAKGARTGEQLAQDLQPISNLNKFFDGFGNTLANVLPASNTAKFLINDARAAQTAGMARTAIKGFGSFFSDMRHLNLAVSMSSSNAAGIYQETQNKLSDEFAKKNGRDPNDLESQSIQDIALKAAKTDGALNSLAILYTNKLAFGNILKPNKAIQETLQQQGEGIFEHINYNSEAPEPFTVKTNNWLSFKANTYALPLEMAKTGAGFGATMSVMEGIDRGVKSYYQAMYDDNHLRGWDVIKDSIDKQFSKEGAQSFISAFLTGTISIGLGGHVINEVRNNPDRFTNPTKFAAREQEAMYGDPKKNTMGAEGVASTLNDAWKNWNNPIKEDIHNFVLQATMDAEKKQAAQSQDNQGLHDAQDNASRQFIIMAAKHGYSDLYLKRVQDQAQNLNPKDLCAAFDLEYSPENYKELKAQLDGFQSRSKDITDVYTQLRRKYPAKVNPNIYNKDTPEYNDALAKFNYHYDALNYLTWVKDIARRGIERQNAVLYGDPKDSTSTGLNSIPGFKDVGESFLYTLVNKDFLKNEITSSRTEHSSLTGLDDKESAKQKNYLSGKINLLETWQKHLEGYSSRVAEALSNSDAVAQSQMLDKARKDFQPIFDTHLANVIDHELVHIDKPILEVDDLISGTKRMLDYTDLSVKSGNALKSANVILHPEIINRFFDSFQKNGAEARSRAQQEAANATARKAQAEDITPEETTPNPTEPIIGQKQIGAETQLGTPSPEVTAEDLAKQKAAELKAKQAQDLQESKKEFQQTRLRNVYNEIIDHLQVEKANLEQKQTDIQESFKQVTESHDKLQELEKKLADPNLVKVDRVNIELAKTEMSLTVATIEKHLEDLKDDALSIQRRIEVKELNLTQSQEGIAEIAKTGLIDTDSRIAEAQKKYEESVGNLDIQKSLTDYAAQKDMFDKEIKSLQGNVDNLKDNLKQIVEYSDVFDAISQIKTKADYVKTLTDLKDKSAGTDKGKFITDLLRLVKHFSGEQVLTKEDIKKIDNNHAFTVAHILNKFVEETEKVTKSEEGKSKLEELANRAHSTQDLEDEIKYYTFLKESFERPENSFIREAPFSNITTETNPETSVNPDLGVVPIERQNTKEPIERAFKPGILFATTGRHFADDKDTIINRQEGIDKAYSYTSDVYLDPNESNWLQIITKDNDTYGITNKEFPQGIKLLRVDEDGNPLDKNNKKTTNKDEMLHWYMPESNNSVKLLEGDLLNPNAPEVNDILTKLKPKYTGANLDKDLRQEIVKYRQTIATVKSQIEKGITPRVKIIGKRQGALNFEPLLNGKVQKNPLSNRVIEKNTNPKYLKDPNGQSFTSWDFGGGRVKLIRADGIKLPVYNRDLTDSEKENAINALKRLSLGGLSFDERKQLGNLLKGTTFFGQPDIESGVVGVNRIWIDYKTGTLKKSTLGTTINPQTKKIENAISIPFTEDQLEKNKDVIFQDAYHNINKSMVEDNNSPYSELKVVSKGNHQYEIQEIAKHENYIGYLISKRENPILTTNIREYKKDNVDYPRVKQSNLDFDYQGNLLPLSEKLQVAENISNSKYPGFTKIDFSKEEAAAFEKEFAETDNFKIEGNKAINKTNGDLLIFDDNYALKEYYIKNPEIQKSITIEAKKAIEELKTEEKQPEQVKPDQVNTKLSIDRQEYLKKLKTVNTKGAEPIDPNCK